MMGNKPRSNVNQISQVLRNKSQSKKNYTKSTKHFSTLHNRYFMFGHL